MKKLIGMCRISTLKQLREGFSLEDQTKQIEDFAKQKEMELVEIVKIQASGKKQLLNVGQLAETIRRAKEIKADLACSKIDRVSRDQITLLMLRKLSKESQIDIHVLSMGRKISEISDMEFSMIAMLAEEERKAIADRCRRSAKARNKVGPIGDSLDPIELATKSTKIRNELAHSWADSIKLRKRIVEAVWSLRQPNLKNVARWLNGEGVVTRRGGRWDGSNLHKQINRLGWSWKELQEL